MRTQTEEGKAAMAEGVRRMADRNQEAYDRRLLVSGYRVYRTDDLNWTIEPESRERGQGRLGYYGSVQEAVLMLYDTLTGEKAKKDAKSLADAVQAAKAEILTALQKRGLRL